MTNTYEVTALDVLLERLAHYDEVTILELLDIDATDLLDRFRERVIERQETLSAEIEPLADETIEGDEGLSDVDDWEGDRGEFMEDIDDE